MGIPLKEPTRRPWTPDDKKLLIGYWGSIGSVAVISILLDRPEGSVQTEASRIGLPRRTEDRGRHRKKWTQTEFDELITIVEKCRTPEGRIRIVEVANRSGRSIDAVVSKLEEHLGSREGLKQTILVNAEEIEAFADAQRKAKVISGDGINFDSRSEAKPRTCLTCRKPFYSSGAGNRICPKCKSADESDWW